MNMHLNKTVLASAAIATAALSAIAFAYKKRSAANTNPLPDYPDTTGTEGLNNIEPGELSPKGDMPTDPRNQN
jgi:hypothetical protein